MYDEKLILEIKDKYGNACSATNSYVSIEKMDNEYQMKVYLECGEESDYIIVIMGCYTYCESDICERRTPTDTAKEVEYEYKKTTGGKWSDWGNWSEWSRVGISKTEYREVETKNVLQNFVSLHKNIEENYEVDMEEQNQVARKLENESAVLLKNNSVLPIGKEKKVIIIGELARQMRFQGGVVHEFFFILRGPAHQKIQEKPRVQRS